MAFFKVARWDRLSLNNNRLSELTPDISEFSYGFALTNELVGWASLSAAPIFPSLIEEGKKGGGYDVKLDQPGAPLYLQFKRADCMLRASAYEIKHHRLPLSTPFYRFPITPRNKSFQHTSLVELDDGTNLVFYAAPRFPRSMKSTELGRTEMYPPVLSSSRQVP